MAIAQYITDLFTILDCDSTTPAGVELTGYLEGGTVAEQDTDYYIQGSACYSAPNARKTGLQSIAVPVTTFTMAADECLFVWQVQLAGNSMETFAAGGLRVALCTDINNYDVWYTGGKDFGRNPYGGWQNVAAWPSYSPDDTLGNLTTYSMVASCLNMVAQIDKGNPHGLDAVRKGRGEIMMWGGEAGAYGNFDTCASMNDIQINRWGLLQVEGTGYLWKGLLSFGKDASVVDFRDSNRVITIDNTPRTYTNFNRVEVNNKGSYIEWNNINFSALSPAQLSRGQFRAISDASIRIDQSSFTDMDDFAFQSRSIITNTTFRRCTSINQGGSTLTDCTFNDASKGVTIYVDDMDLIQGAAFRSNGSNHAMYLGPDSSGATYSITGHAYTNYATVNGATGNEVIWNNSGGLVVVNYSGGDQPTYRDTGDSSTQVVSSVTLTLTVTGEDQLPIVGAKAYIDDPGNTEPYIMNTLTNASGIASTGWGGGPVSGAYWRVRLYGYKPFLAISDIGASDKEIPVTLVKDPQQY